MQESVSVSLEHDSPPVVPIYLQICPPASTSRGLKEADPQETKTPWKDGYGHCDRAGGFKTGDGSTRGCSAPRTLGDATSPAPGNLLSFLTSKLSSLASFRFSSSQRRQTVVASEGQSSPGPSPRRWLRSKVASAAAGGVACVPRRFRLSSDERCRPIPPRQTTLTIALISFRENSSLVVTGDQTNDEGI